MKRLLVGLGAWLVVVAVAGCGSGNDFQTCNGCGDDDAGLAGAAGAAGAGGTAGSGGAGGGAAGDAAAGGSGGVPLATNGTTCSDASECQSGYCSDGVCCDSACEGICEECALAGQQGTCSATPSGSDPADECAGSDETCAGSCDGARGCEYPVGECGASTCSSGQRVDSLCDGLGACQEQTTGCAPYLCDQGACTTLCTGHTECADTGYCNSSGQCVYKKANGEVCGENAQCTSGTCAGGRCCQTACNSPASCDTGTCLCGGTECAAGVQCVTWYLDQDGDTHAQSSTHDTASCADQQPPAVGGKLFYKSATDCYDQNPQAKPGQTGWYYQDRGDGSFDYDCNGATDYQYPVTALTQCKDCEFRRLNSVGTYTCTACGGFDGIGPRHTMGFTCNAGECNDVKSRSAFKTSIACGDPGTLYTCPSDSCSFAPTSTNGVPQGCR